MENKDDLIPKYDKSKWSRGEWDNEPDRADFIHAGYSCFVLRNQSGNWCGYVGIPLNHPSARLHGDEPGHYDYNYVDVDVHGGLTYAHKCSPPICHIPEKGMPAEVLWLGFDTAHSWDLSPARNRQFNFGGNELITYKNIDYIRKETESLAEQLKEIG